ncbi:hypothetical protein Tco_0261558 [Tanacetum coccineum]
MIAITTRSGVAYEGPSIPTNPSPKKEVERETEETTDKDNPTPTFEPLTSEFILEEIEAYLKDVSISPEIDHCQIAIPEGDICLIEKLLNNGPFQLPLMDLKQGEIIKAKPSMEEPLELELKDLPSHLEYAYIKKTTLLTSDIAKGLKR